MAEENQTFTGFEVNVTQRGTRCTRKSIRNQVLAPRSCHFLPAPRSGPPWKQRITAGDSSYDSVPFHLYEFRDEVRRNNATPLLHSETGGVTESSSGWLQPRRFLGTVTSRLSSRISPRRATFVDVTVIRCQFPFRDRVVTACCARPPRHLFCRSARRVKMVRATKEGTRRPYAMRSG